jgi:hypothetical protein
MGVAISNRRDDDIDYPSVTTSNTRSRTRRARPVPYLRLVPDLPEPVADREETAERYVLLGEPEICPEQQPERGEPAPYRPIVAPIHLTRRGRIVVWLILLAAAVAVLALLAPASQASPPAAQPKAVTVHAGDTMWSIATTELPRVSPAVAMERIRLLNHLPSDEVYAGEQILVPAA